MNSPDAFVAAKTRRKRFFSFNTFAQTPGASPSPMQDKQSPPTSKGSARKQLTFGAEPPGSPQTKGSLKGEVRNISDTIRAGAKKPTSNGPSSCSASHSSTSSNCSSSCSCSCSSSSDPSSLPASLPSSPSARTSKNSIASNKNAAASIATSTSISTSIVSESRSFSNVASSRPRPADKATLSAPRPSFSGVGPPTSRAPGSRPPNSIVSTAQSASHSRSQPQLRPKSPSPQLQKPQRQSKPKQLTAAQSPVPARVSAPISPNSSPEPQHPHLTPLWLCFLDNPEHYLPDYVPPAPLTAHSRHQPQRNQRRRMHQPNPNLQLHQQAPRPALGPNDQRSHNQLASESSPLLSNVADAPPRDLLQQPLAGTELMYQQQLQGSRPLSQKQLRIRTQKRRLVEREQQQRFLALLAQLTKNSSPPIMDRPRSQSLSLVGSQLPPKNRSLSDVFERPDLLQSVEKGSIVQHRDSILSTPQKLTKVSSPTPQKSPPAAIQVQTTMQQLLSLKMQQEEQKEIEQELQYKLRAQLIKQKRKLKDKAKKDRAKSLAAEKASDVSAPKILPLKVSPPTKTTPTPITPTPVKTPSKLRVEAPLWEAKESSVSANVANVVSLTEKQSQVPPSRRLPTPDRKLGVESKASRSNSKSTPSLSPQVSATPPRHTKNRSSPDVGEANDVDGSSSGFSSSGSNSDSGDKRMALRFGR